MPIVTIIIVILFFAAALSAVNSREIFKKEIDKVFDAKDLIIITVLTCFTAVLSFWHLGNTKAPQEFVRLDSTNHINVCASEDTYVSEILFYLGQCPDAVYTVVGVDDAGNERESFFITHAYTSNFVWERLDVKGERLYKEFNIYTEDSGNIGEIALIDIDGNVISSTCNEDILCDDGDILCLESTYENSTYFDEIYYVRTAWEMDNRIYPYENTHPPLGKILILLGTKIFGLNPFGWRFMGTLFGVLLVPLMYAFIRLLTKQRNVSICTTLLLMFDLMRFSQSRLTTIDTYAVFFSLFMFLLMYLFVLTDKVKWLIACGIAFGLGISTKWTCFYAGAGLAVIWAGYWVVNYKKGFKAFCINSGICVLSFIVAPALICYLTYIPYALSENIYNPLSVDYLKVVTDNIKSMYSYHSNLESTHPYSSVWYQWLFNIRPILYYARYPKDGVRNVIMAMLNPIVCWAGLCAIIVTSVCAVVKKDIRAIIISVGYWANLVPWILVTRCTFEYHYFTSAMFLILAIGYCFEMMWKGKWYQKYMIYVVTAMCIVLFICFYPVVSGTDLHESFRVGFIHWMDSWPF